MASNNYKQKKKDTPIEKHDSAAWSNGKKTKPVTNEIIPDQTSVRNAKEHVDSNQK